MLTLAVFADDLTGALDTGVQFAASGVKTAVTAGQTPPENCTVAVCDIRTRHVSPAEALSRTQKALRHALAHGAQYLYIKTDSGMRGNIGSELAALYAVNGRVFFVPSYPENGRITVRGMHFIDGVPVSRSLFGHDAQNPVRHDRVADILHETADLPLYELRAGEAIPDTQGVFLADAETDEELAAHAKAALRAGITCFAGCAGLAKQLAPALKLPHGADRPRFSRGKLLTVCGSISPISLKQIAAARSANIPCFRLRDIVKKGYDGLWDTLQHSGCAVVASAFEEADICKNDLAGLTVDTVAMHLGVLACHAIDRYDCGLFVIGGDTLAALVQSLGSCTIVPSFEASSGVVVCTLLREGAERLLVTKSGSFGGQDAITGILRRYTADRLP